METGKMIDPVTFEFWAKIVLDIWKDRMMKYNVRQSGALFSSLQQHVLKHAGDDVSKIDFFFNYYGIYVDMGVGREFNIGNSGDVGKDKGMLHPRRVAKPWYATAFYGQVKRLSEILEEKYGREAAQRICGFISAGANEKVLQYRKASNTRSARNKSLRKQAGFSIENSTYTIN